LYYHRRKPSSIAAANVALKTPGNKHQPFFRINAVFLRACWPAWRTLPSLKCILRNPEHKVKGDISDELQDVGFEPYKIVSYFQGFVVFCVTIITTR
jgi:hypothetical protein